MKDYEKEIEYIFLDLEDDVLDKLKKTYERALKDVQNKAKELQDEIDKLIQDVDPDDEIKISQIRSKVYQLQYQRNLEKQIDNFFEVMKDENVNDINDYLNKVYSNGFLTEQYRLMNNGIDITMPINQKLLTKAITFKTEDIPLSTRIYKNVDKAKKDIISEISRGLSIGMSNTDIARNLKNTMGVSTRKACQIAQNEGARVRQSAIIDSMHEAKKKGADIVKQWSATLDGKTRPVHQELDGKYAEIDEDFEYSGGKVFAPKQFGIPSEDINCRCTLLTVPRWDMEDTHWQMDNETKELVNVKNYQDWYNKIYIKSVENVESNIKPKTDNIFKPAESLEKAEDFAKNILGIKNVSYKGNDLTTANEWNKGLADTFNRFPELKNKFGFTGDCRERNEALKPVVEEYITNELLKQYPQYTKGQLQRYIDESVNKFMRKMSVSNKAFAQSWTPAIDILDDFSGITVNSDYGKNSKSFIEILAENVKSKFHPEGCDTIRSVLDHEIGHQLDNLLDIRNIKDIQKLYDDKTHEELTEALSEYAWKNKNPNKYAEMIAEGWAEYCNNPNPRGIAKKIGETIIKEYEKKYGNNP